MKLLPIEVSKGEGRGVVTTVMEGLIEVETAVGEMFVEVSVAMADVIAAADEEEDVVDAAPESDVEVGSDMLVGMTLSCRRWISMVRPSGGSARSMCISPRSASS